MINFFCFAPDLEGPLFKIPDDEGASAVAAAAVLFQTGSVSDRQTKERRRRTRRRTRRRRGRKRRTVIGNRDQHGAHACSPSFCH